MARMKYLSLKDGSPNWQVRITVPHHLRKVVGEATGKPEGRSVLKRSTETSILKDAERSAPAIIAEFNAILDKAERGELFWINREISEWVNSFIDRAELVEGIRRDPEVMSREIATFADQNGIRGNDFEAFKRMVDGRYPVRVVRPVLRFEPAKPVPAPLPKGGTSLSVFRKDYLERRGFDDKRKLEITRAFRFLERISGDVDLESVTPEHIRKCTKLMQAYPHGLIPQREADKMEPAEVIAAHVAGKWVRTMNEDTAKKNLSFIRSAFEYAANDGKIAVNPAVGIKILDKPATQVSTKKRQFKSDELQTLMLSPLFKACAGSDRVGQLAKPGDVEVRDYRFWMPWVALYTAGRLEEVAKLTRDSLQQEDGVWFLHIEGTKTERSVRDVPVHDHLIQLGFLEFAQKQQDRLFPEYEDTKEGAKQFSKFFGRYMDKLHLSDPTISFHSLRHSWIGRAKKTSIPRDAWQQMSAHQDEKNVGDDYADDARPRMVQLKLYMDRIRFEGITPE